MENLKIDLKVSEPRIPTSRDSPECSIFLRINSSFVNQDGLYEHTTRTLAGATVAFPKDASPEAIKSAVNVAVDDFKKTVCEQIMAAEIR